MTTKEFIASGRLEMYVLGHLSAEENIEIGKLRREDSEIDLEIQKIELAIIQLTSSVSPTLSSEMLDAIISAQTPSSINLDKKKETNWAAILGWTSSLLLFLAAVYLGYENYAVSETQAKNQDTKTAMLVEIDSIKQLGKQNEWILELLRVPATQKYVLESEDNSTDVTATLYYNHNQLTAILDLSNLPILGQGEVYKLWTITETEEKLLYNSIFLNEDSEKEKSNLYILDGVTANRFVLSIETDRNSAEPSVIRFIQKEKQL